MNHKKKNDNLEIVSSFHKVKESKVMIKKHLSPLQDRKSEEEIKQDVLNRGSYKNPGLLRLNE
jgi:hypothetical protein